MKIKTVAADDYNLIVTIAFSLIRKLDITEVTPWYINRWQSRFNTALRRWCDRNKCKYDHVYVVEIPRNKDMHPTEKQFFPHSHNAVYIPPEKFHHFEAFVVGWVMKERCEAGEDARPTIINAPGSVLMVNKLSKNTKIKNVIAYMSKESRPKKGRSVVEIKNFTKKPKPE